MLFRSSAQEGTDEDIFQLARIGDTIAIEHLRSIDPDTVNAVNKYGHTPLILASYHDQKETVAYLIRNGANVNYTFMQGSAIHGAAFKGYTDVARILLSKGIKVNVPDNNGSTPLIYATLFGHNEIAKLLFTEGADVHMKDKSGSSALDYARSLENEELLRIFEIKNNKR
ncbi:MAG: ankyrin repeat domain-containing protein [Chitinophagales bacterium]|nr:ankyrin repeat domain-containing protein [Chitinophagales bacterium]